MGTSPDQLRYDIERTRADLTHSLDTLAEKVNPASVVHRRFGDARGAISGIKERVMGAAETIGGHAGDTASTVQERVTSAPTAVRSTAQGNPLAAGVVAFGVGLLVGSMLPASEPEQQAAVALKDRAQPLAEEETQQLKASMAPVAQDAADQVKWAAQDAAATTMQEATSAAGEVADHGRNAAAETRSGARDTLRP